MAAIRPDRSIAHPTPSHMSQTTDSNSSHLASNSFAIHSDDHSVDEHHAQDPEPEPEHVHVPEQIPTPDLDSDTDELEAVQRADDKDLERGIDVDVEAEGCIGVANGGRDLEPGLVEKKSARSVKDLNLVTWDGPGDPENPRNWPRQRKWIATFVVSSFTFISPVSSSMVAPALASIGAEFGTTSKVQEEMVMSIFVLAYAVGPLFLGPLSEIYGRVPVLQLANLVYLVFNTACGASRSNAEMIAFRFLSGIGGSAPLVLGGGVISDAWRADERGAALSIYLLMPLLGPAIGPIAGGFITQRTTWRWAFYATSIADALIQLSGLFFLRETYHPKLLHAKAAKLRLSTGNMALHTEYEHAERTLTYILRTNLQRPFRLIGTQAIVQVLALYMAYLYGLLYLVLATFPALWATRYHQSIAIGGLNYISLGLGFFFGTQVCAPLNDRVYCALRARNAGVGRPEFRLPLMVPASVLVPVGLLVYGWAAEYEAHWAWPNLGAGLFAAGLIVCFNCISTYLVDAYTRYASSAIGAATVLRSFAGFGFPLFAPYMYASLNYGWGNSLLAFIAIAIGLPAPLLIWVYGERLRARSPYAAGGGE